MPEILFGYLDFKVIDAQPPAECPAKLIFSQPRLIRSSTLFKITYCFRNCFAPLNFILSESSLIILEKLLFDTFL